MMVKETFLNTNTRGSISVRVKSRLPLLHACLDWVGVVREGVGRGGVGWAWLRTSWRVRLSCGTASWHHPALCGFYSAGTNWVY